MRSFLVLGCKALKLGSRGFGYHRSMTRRRDRGLTAIELMVVIVVIGIAAAVTVPAILRGSRNDLLVRCESNLRALGRADADARAKGHPPQGAGRAYWASLVQPEQAAMTVCPLSGHSHYRGPKGDFSQLPPNAPIGADAPGSHGAGQGGFVLLKSGEVRAVREGDRLWQDAAHLLGP
jgi:prepilin-type N-terminal cleavage/methylation domain-containing protein